VFLEVAGATVLPFLLWSVFKAARMTSMYEVRAYRANTMAFLRRSSGVGKAALFGHGLAGFEHRVGLIVKELASGLGGKAWLAHLTACVFAAAGLLAWRGRSGARTSAAAALFAGGLAPLLFWMVNDPFLWYRRILPFVFILAVAVIWTADALSADASTRRWAVALAVMAIVPRLPLTAWWAHVPHEVAARRVAIEQTAAAMNDWRERQPARTIWAPGWNYSQQFAFFRPEPIPFGLCSNDAAPVAPGDLWISDRWQQETCFRVSAACEKHPVYQDDFYALSRCGDDLPLRP
jgi:hypothetical protein